MPYISIIIPIYNGISYFKKLEDNINYFLSFNNIEVIVIDDGSNDGCSLLLEKIQGIVYFKQENSGVSIARNTGLNISKGEYVIFFDSDDDLDLEILKYFCFFDNKKDVTFFNYSISGEIVNKLPSMSCVNSMDLFYLFLNKKINLTICSIIIKRSFLINNNISFIRGLPLGEDILFIFKILNSNIEVSYLDKNLFNYNLSVGGAAKSRVSYSKANMLKFFTKYREELNCSNDIMEAYDFYLKNLYLYLVKNSILYGLVDKRSGDFVIDNIGLIKKKIKFRNFKFTIISSFFSFFYKFVYFYLVFLKVPK